MPDVPVDTILLGLVEDFVPTAGVEPVVQREVAFRHLPGDKALDRGGLPPTGSSVPATVRIGSSARIRDSFSASHGSRNPLITEYVISLENGLPHSGSLRNSRMSSRSRVRPGVVSHADNERRVEFASRFAKNWLGALASEPVASACGCAMTPG